MQVEWDEQSEELIVTTKYNTFRINAIFDYHNECFYCIPNQDFLYAWGNQRKEMSEFGFQVTKNNGILNVRIDCNIKFCGNGDMQISFIANK